MVFTRNYLPGAGVEGRPPWFGPEDGLPSPQPSTSVVATDVGACRPAVAAVGLRIAHNQPPSGIHPPMDAVAAARLSLP